MEPMTTEGVGALRLKSVAGKVAKVGVAIVITVFVGTGVALARPHELRVSPSGAVGPLHINRSTGIAVIWLMGWPDALGSGNFHAFPRTPNFEALGYSCSPGSSASTTMHVPGSGLACQIVFFINMQTERLAGFWSYSPEVVGPSGIQSGDSAIADEQRLGKQALGGCYSGFFLGKRHSPAQMFVWVDGGVPASQSNDTIIGGNIGPFELESKRHSVGLLFC